MASVAISRPDMIDGSLLIRSFKHSAETRPQTCDDHIRKFASLVKQDITVLNACMLQKPDAAPSGLWELQQVLPKATDLRIWLMEITMHRLMLPLQG
jgi:hypothetical protein